MPRKDSCPSQVICLFPSYPHAWVHLSLLTLGEVASTTGTLSGGVSDWGLNQRLNPLLSADAKGLSNPSEVETLREKVYATLEAYTKQKYPEQPGRWASDKRMTMLTARQLLLTPLTERLPRCRPTVLTSAQWNKGSGVVKVSSVCIAIHNLALVLKALTIARTASCPICLWACFSLFRYQLTEFGNIKWEVLEVNSWPFSSFCHNVLLWWL